MNSTDKQLSDLMIHLDSEINKLKKDLKLSINSNGFINPKTLDISREIDQYVLECQYIKINNMNKARSVNRIF
ncbi:Spo0E family sporulation regulatory protein-aspartic acid phosphatase [Metabacillus schmidteae]|uniref:Spo0E family sporulation regulatory protein-aspartic acid phosphatase n=1 Tax=Metabacillus schmidteae TaxID=2730405 RepID=UPI00158D9E4A|nr:Spo0E family sporulation regulatory protein-aspartic acid phosphatase [Metabacillus schmidteae]